MRLIRKGPPAALRLLFLCALAGLAGCASVAPPDAGELGDIEAGRKVFLLLRVAASIGGDPNEPFAHSLADDNFGIAVGSFETGGRPQRVESLRFLSEESRALGWTYLSVPPGTIYLAFLPQRRTDAFTYLAMFRSAQPWRVDPPAGSRFVYAGTLVVEGTAGKLLFEGKFLEKITRMEIRDESDAARGLLQRYVPEAGSLETALMKRHEGPIILTTPPD